MHSRLIIGTRSSKLALWQANFVKDELKKYFPSACIELKTIKTKGDHITDISLSKIGGKGLFTKEIEDALLKGEIDLAAHSLKDLPVVLPHGLKIGAILKGEKPHDVLISTMKLVDLPSLSKLGTTSLRRTAQLKAIRPDLDYVDLRGNLDTRIRKFQNRQYDAIVLAYAGVKRMGYENLISEHFNPEEFLPAVGQGAIAIELRNNDKETENFILKLNDEETFLTSVAQRSFLGTLQGGCQVPIGAYAKVEKSSITLYGLIASLDGKKVIRDSILFAFNPEECQKAGRQLAEKLLRNGGEAILTELKSLISLS